MGRFFFKNIFLNVTYVTWEWPIFFTIIMNSICKKNCRKSCSWPILQSFSSSGVYLSVPKHNMHLMFFNIEEPYDKLPKHLNSAITKLLYCFYRGLKMVEMEKLQNFTFFLIFKPTKLVRKSLQPYKTIYILQVFLEMCLETWPKWKGHPKNPCATIWKLWKPNSFSSFMSCLHKKLWVVP